MDCEMVTSSSQSSKTKTSPESVRILVVDDDYTCLTVVSRMLQTCKYQVLVIKRAVEAITILRDRVSRFDLVLTDVHMPEMNGFELLDQVNEEFKLPVVMMSGDSRENVTLRALENGAVYYFMKPISMKDLKNLWQFAFTPKKEITIATEQMGSVHSESATGKVSEEDIEYESSVNKRNCRQQDSKRKVPKERDGLKEGEENDSAKEKKSRVIWTSELHNRFLDAIDQLGLNKAVPKRILDLMSAPELTRENVASHLQKYRLFLKRVQEASRSRQPNLLAKTLGNGVFRSSFVSGNPLLMLNTQQGLPRFPEQHRLPTTYQPGFGGNIQNLNVSVPMASIGHANYFNREASASNSRPHQLSYIQSLQVSNQGNLQPPFSAAARSNHRNDANNLVCGMEPHHAQMATLLHGDTSRGLMRGTDPMQMINQQPQAKLGLFVNEPIDNNFNMLGYHGQNSTFTPEKMGSWGSSNQLPGFNYYNTNYAGNQMTNTGDQLVGSGQMGPIGGKPSNDIGYSNNLVDEISSGYIIQGESSSGGFGSANQFPTLFTNVMQQEQAPCSPLPPQSLQEQEENSCAGTGGGGEGESLFDLINSSSTFGNIYLNRSFDDVDFSDLIFDDTDETPDQQQGKNEDVDPEFGISDFELDDIFQQSITSDED